SSFITNIFSLSYSSNVNIPKTPPDSSQTILQNYETTLAQLENLESHTVINMLSSSNPDEFTKYFMEYVDTKTSEAKEVFQKRYSLSERDMKIYEEEV